MAILGIWQKYDVIPPRYYSVPNYGIQIEGSIHMLSPNWWIVIVIPLHATYFIPCNTDFHYSVPNELLRFEWVLYQKRKKKLTGFVEWTKKMKNLNK